MYTVSTIFTMQDGTSVAPHLAEIQQHVGLVIGKRSTHPGWVSLARFVSDDGTVVKGVQTWEDQAAYENSDALLAQDPEYVTSQAQFEQWQTATGILFTREFKTV